MGESFSSLPAFYHNFVNWYAGNSSKIFMPFSQHPSPAKGAALALSSTIFSLLEILLLWANDLFARLFYHWLYEYTEKGEEERKKCGCLHI